VIDGRSSVLDASALLAYLRDEQGSMMVDEALARGAVMNAVNWAEVLSRLTDETGEEVDSIIRRLTEEGLVGGLLDLLPLTVEDAVTIAQLRSTTRPHGLSLADRACLATGLRLGLTVLTADRTWDNLSLQTVIRVIR
jgi:PIN domain nuclease of toxin-antitoxin system